MSTFWLILCLSAISFNSHGVYGRKQCGIYRPCKLTDLDCIREYFATNFNLTVSEGPVPDPYKSGPIRLQMPYANMTMLLSTNYTLTGLSDGKITELYINRTSGNVVLEVSIKALYSNDSSTTIIVHRKGKEPLDLVGSIYFIERQVSFTLVFLYKNGVEISENTVYTNIGDPNISYEFGPSFSSEDPLVRAAFRRAEKNILTTVLESYQTAGSLFMRVFFESNICKLNKPEECTC